jgi:hypothetical protein
VDSSSDIQYQPVPASYTHYGQVSSSDNQRLLDTLDDSRSNENDACSASS